MQRRVRRACGFRLSVHNEWELERQCPIRPLALEVRGVTKAFGPIVALNNVSFTLRRGEIHALVGHNGAGKSTLVKVLAGVVSPDQGEILIKGTPVTLTNARQAQAAGIAVVEQELSLVPALTVLENILLGRVGAGFRSRAETIAARSRAC